MEKAETDRKALGRYDLLLKLYDGEPGTVWAARERGAAPNAALMSVHEIPFGGGVPESAADRLTEAWEWTADLQHEGIVPAKEVVVDDRGLAVVSAYQEGEPYGSVLRLASVRRVVFAPAVVLRIALDVLDGLAHLHGQATEQSVAGERVYGAISPNNLLLGRDGKTRILCPGVYAAAAQQKGWREDPKRAAYAAPEVVDGTGGLDPGSDLFSLGIVLWELLQNKRLFAALSLPAVLKKVTSQPVERVDASKPAGGEPVSVGVADIIARVLGRDRAARFASALEVVDAIEQSGAAIATHADVAKMLEQLAGKALAARRSSMERVARGERLSLAPAAPKAPVAAKRDSKPGDAATPRPSKPGAPRPPGLPPAGKPGAAPLPPRAKPAGGPPVPKGGAAGEVYDEVTVEDDLEGAAAGTAPRPGGPKSAKAIGTEWEGPVSERAVESGKEPRADAGAEEEEGGEDEIMTGIWSDDQAKAAIDAIDAKVEAARAEAAADEEPAEAAASPKLPATEDAGPKAPAAARRGTRPDAPGSKPGHIADVRFDEKVEEEGAGTESVREADIAPPAAVLAAAAEEDKALLGDDAEAPDEADEPKGPTTAEAAPEATAEELDEATKRKKKLVLLGGAAGAIVVAIIVVLATGSSDPSQPGTTTATPTTAVTTAAATTAVTSSTSSTETTTGSETAAQAGDAGTTEAPGTTAAPTTTTPTPHATRTTPPATTGAGTATRTKTKTGTKPPRYVPNDL